MHRKWPINDKTFFVCRCFLQLSPNGFLISFIIFISFRFSRRTRRHCFCSRNIYRFAIRLIWFSFAVAFFVVFLFSLFRLLIFAFRLWGGIRYAIAENDRYFLGSKINWERNRNHLCCRRSEIKKKKSQKQQIVVDRSGECKRIYAVDNYAASNRISVESEKLRSEAKSSSIFANDQMFRFRSHLRFWVLCSSTRDV